MKKKNTWKELILAAMTGRNNRGIPLWYDHAGIYRRLSEAHGEEATRAYRSLSAYLLALVKSGHLERAIKPRHLSTKVQYDGKPEYLYRVTGKPFTRGGLQECDNTRKAILAHDLWRMYPRLPKWYRRMMLD